MYFKEIATVTDGVVLESYDPKAEITNIVIDSRKPFAAGGAIFFAIKGERHDGHRFARQIYDRGCRNFVVEEDVNLSGANLISVKNTTEALQKVAAYHRRQFDIEVVGITGSNGKTIVKEWLYACLSSAMKIAKSPHSYNSQIGVPLSVWNLSPSDELAIFEAGISTTGEMEKLADIIRPVTGIFTNLGSAHDEGFDSRERKFREKARLFATARKVVYNSDDPQLSFGQKGFAWGSDEKSDVVVLQTEVYGRQTRRLLRCRNHTLEVAFPFTDRPSLENAMHCVAYMLMQGYSPDFIREGIGRLQKLAMRLELKRAINNSYIIDDTYNNDLVGLEQAIAFLAAQHQRSKKIVILSDLLQSGLSDDVLYAKVAGLLSSAGVEVFIGIGPAISAQRALFSGIITHFFTHTRELIDNPDFTNLADAVILIKGARPFQFENVSKLLEEKIHGTVLEISLDALTNNLNSYRSLLSPSVGLMVMIKAFAYGNGSYEVANLLQFHRVSYLAVAYNDEGVQLRKNGITLPIMVMNPHEDTFASITKHQLEPVIYNAFLLDRFIRFLHGKACDIHLEIDTGMRRLGFGMNELGALVDTLNRHTNLRVKSIFSHMAAADEAGHDLFSQTQATTFEQAAARISHGLGYKPLKHLVNSSGIVRFPQYHYDMVRLGIGFYGFETTLSERGKLQPVGTLKTVISQIHTLQNGDTVGYGRKGVASEGMQLATIAIGYADGFSRALGNGVGEVVIRGRRAPVVGNVCMDMTMVDVTGFHVEIGDEVEIFGGNIPVTELASKTNTIPYEILTNVSQRVKRVFHVY